MWGKSQTALEIIKKTKGCGGMTKLQVQLAEEQLGDMRAMKEEIVTIKKDISELKSKCAEANTTMGIIAGKLDVLIAQRENRPFLQITTELLKTRGFWIVLALIVIGIYGIDLSGLKEFLK